MKRDVLGASQPSLPLSRNVRYGVAGPIVNAATYNTRQRPGSYPVLRNQRQPANALDADGIELIGPPPKENDDGLVDHYDLSEYATLYYPSERAIDPKNGRTTPRKNNVLPYTRGAMDPTWLAGRRREI